MAITVSAIAIAATSQLWPSRHLRPFAMWTAFPSSDYYGRSVAMSIGPLIAGGCQLLFVELSPEMAEI